MAILSVSTIKLTGKFDSSDALLWCSNCLNDLPQHLEGTIQDYFYKNSLLGTILKLTVEEGALTIESDNLSAVAIIKDQFTIDAGYRKLNIELADSEIDFNSLQDVLNILHKLVQPQYDIADKNKLIDGLKEVSSEEKDLSFMNQEYRNILSQAESIQAQIKEQPKMLNYFWSVIADLFGDACKMKGKHNMGTLMSQLRDLLKNNYSRESLIQFFNVNIN